MLPQGSSDSDTGLPTLVRHCTRPLRSSSAYSESPSVATRIRSPTTSGWPYTAPSSRALHARVSRVGVGHAGQVPGAGVVAVVGGPAAVAGGRGGRGARARRQGQRRLLGRRGLAGTGGQQHQQGDQAERGQPTRTRCRHAHLPATGACGVGGGLRPGRMSGRLLHAGHRRGHGWSLQPPRTCSWSGARRDTVPTAAIAGHGWLRVRMSMVGVRPAWPPGRLCGNRSGLSQTPPDASTVAVRHAVQVPDTADGLRRRLSPTGHRYYGNRSPGRRPLVGCSQRRWTRANRAVRRPRSWPRT